MEARSVMRIACFFVLVTLVLVVGGCAPAPESVAPTASQVVKPTLEITDADLHGWIAVCVNNTDGIRVMLADGSQVSEPITESWSCDPDWSPDGDRLAFVVHGYNLAVADQDGGNIQVLTACSGICEFPDWSPNAKKIVFNTGHLKRVGSNEYISGGDILVMNADGSEQVVIYDQCVASHATWSPDSRQIAFQADCNDRKDIYKMDADGGNVTQLTTGPGNHTEPAWSPDGKFIAFVAGNKLSFMKKDGSRLRQLPAEDAHFPAWSPDGQYIAFNTKSGQVRVIRVDGTGLRDINFGVDPSWGP
jgi:Tol biopolymer transport system component